MLRKIALEEHFLSPGLIEYWTPTVAELDRRAADLLFRRLTDVGDARLEEMTRAGIERAVLSIAGPGVQGEPVIATAIRKASEANDFLAREIRKRPQSLLGFAHLPMQDPAAAAAELERAMHDLEFCGALIHGHSHGKYLDDPAFDPFWERAEALGAPVYLHHAEPTAPAPVLAGYRELRGPGWESAFETGSHILRLVYGGVFDRYPKARLIVGRLGETLPYLLWRLDAQAQREAISLARPPSDYFRSNIFVTTAGLLSASSLYCAVAALGPAQVMFATGYPFEPMADSGHFLDAVRLDEGLRADIAFRNAERLFGL
jgi:2,3-dihydroxybenzoate decarboxylase